MVFGDDLVEMDVPFLVVVLEPGGLGLEPSLVVNLQLFLAQPYVCIFGALLATYVYTLVVDHL